MSCSWRNWGEFCIAYQVRILTYCLMPNHVHLFLRTELPNLSRFMQGLRTSFNVVKNRRERTSGHVFQGRFKSQLVEATGYFDVGSRYIHLNPVRVEKVQALPVEEKRDILHGYEWSSFPAPTCPSRAEVTTSRAWGLLTELM